jgi:peroxiredoxin
MPGSAHLNRRNAMALTPSSMVLLGTPAPDFSLPDTDGKIISLGDFAAAPAVLIAFICNHCPYVHHVRSAFARLAKDYQAKGVAVIAICSNDAVAYPDDSPKQMAIEKRTAGYTFPYLHDETQDATKAYGAVCTPDFFVYDRERKLVYRGQMDDSRPGNGKPNDGADLRAALDAVLADRLPSSSQKASVGCSIKWKPGR